MSRTLHLHVGMPKCGSSSLQDFLLHNADALAERGFAYPMPPGAPKANLKPYMVAATGAEVGGVFGHINRDIRLDSAIDDLWAAVAAAEAPNVVLSSETVYKHRDEAILGDLVKRFDHVRVHLVLRPKVDWIVSHYAQHVKTGSYDIPIEPFLASDRFRNEILPRVAFADHLAFWQRRFGAENVAIHFAGGRHGSVVTQFLADVGLHIAQPAARGPRNRSPSAFQLAACIAANTGDQSAFLASRAVVLRFSRLNDPDPDATFLTAEVEARLAPLLSKDTEALVRLQDRVTAQDLHPDNSAKHARAVTFESVVASEAFARLGEDLKRKGIALRTLPGAGG